MLPVLAAVFGIGTAYAEPIEDVTVTVLESDGVSGTVQATWNDDSSVAKYEIGCVSCMPNTSEFTTETSLVLEDVSPFPNTSNVMLYLIAYDAQDEIIHAKQILVSLEQ